MKPIPTPIELLQEQFEELKRALSKSTNLYKKSLITEDIHTMHCANLVPKIDNYEKAIAKLLDL
jgi:hypothetical protein